MDLIITKDELTETGIEDAPDQTPVKRVHNIISTNKRIDDLINAVIVFNTECENTGWNKNSSRQLVTKLQDIKNDYQG